MENCLVTTLKGQVNNPKLVELGFVMIPIVVSDTSGSTVLEVVFEGTSLSDNKKIKVYDAQYNLLNTFTANAQHLISISASQLPSNSAFLKIYKYDLKKITVYPSSRGVDIKVSSEMFAYSNKLTEVTIDSKFTPDDNLNDLTNGKDVLTKLVLAGGNLTGTADMLASAKQLTNVNIRSCKNITGSIESWCEKLFADYTTDKTISLNANKLTFNSLPNDYTTTSISLTSTGVVVTTFYNGQVTGTYNGSSWSYTGF